MRILKPSAITAAFAAAVVYAGVAAAGQPATIESAHAQDAATIDSSQQVVPTARKVYQFEKLDLNHNGRLSRAEIPLDMHSLRRDFVRADYTGDGQISPTEYVMYRDGRVPQYVGVSHTLVFVYRNHEQHESRIAIR